MKSQGAVEEGVKEPHGLLEPWVAESRTGVTFDQLKSDRDSKALTQIVSQKH